MQQPSVCTSTVFNKALLLQAEPPVQPADALSMQHIQLVWPGWGACRSGSALHPLPGTKPSGHDGAILVSVCN